MGDVHMEDAGQALGTQGESTTSTETSVREQDTSGSALTEPASARQEDSMGANSNVPESTSSLGKDQEQEPKASEGGNGAVEAATTSTVQAGKESDSMDLDPTTPAEGAKPEGGSAQGSKASEAIGSGPVAPPHTKESDETGKPSPAAELQPTAVRSVEASSTELESRHDPSGSTDQHATSDTQKAPATTSSSTTATLPGDTQLKTKVPGSETKKEPGSSTAATLAVPPPQPVRAYIPQFRFTTFTPMTPLPTRNVTSNFLKTEKNYVLKNMARRRRRKRKADEDTAVEGESGVESKGEEDKAEEDEKKDATNGLLKRKRKDEFSAIRRGIFADEDEDEDEDKEENVDEEDRKEDRKDDDEDEYEDSSDSDSVESVVNEMDENGEAKSTSDAGKKIIVIHPGSRILRIGRASDAYPVAIPHCIARRMHSTPVTVTTSKTPATQSTDATESNTETSSTDANEQQDDGTQAEDDSAMDVDASEDMQGDVVNDKYLREIENDLKIRMKAAKRRPVPNAKSQVKSFNASSEPERILDINDPYKVEWTDPAAEGEYVVGQKALNLPPSKSHTFKLFWPIVEGNLNDKDYETPRAVAADLETIWTNVIKDDLGIEPKKFRKHYALLVIPDLYNKLYVTELVNTLLKSMQFRGVIALQESVCAAFGAGISTACVVDIGAEVTKVACVEDGVCIANSRAVLKYGGDDITRCFTALVKRTGFPYREVDLAQTYDWRLMEELKEKWCTLNEADLTVQVYNFFVRRPEKHTQKYQVKVHDEVALSPMCLFFPGVIRRRIEQRDTNPTFAKIANYEDINEDAPPIALMNQSSKKSSAAAAAAVAAARAGTPAAGEDNNGGATPSVGTPGATPASTPAPSASTGAAPPPVAPVHHPFGMDPSVTTTDNTWEIAGTIGKDHFSSLVALDIVVAQSISNCGSEERSKKLYGSIILVGGGGMIQGFDRVLEDRLFQALPATLTTVEKVEVLPSPRDMDPRLLVWKGGSVLGKLESARELWIKPLEWELQGRKVLRDKSLFFWGKD
ncbi:hypothetical protein B0O80DRAFT_417516 [Mortierella sp. GBAus27b]|nr:hypothetical protein B0O80DRAFT_417516 [Mortierella sp. GBAus27b]